MKHASRSLSGLVVAITGGGRGIGAATARVLADRGAKVAIGDVDLASARHTAESMGERGSAFPLDVRLRSSFAEYLDAAEDRFGQIDVLINNAGIMPLARVLEEDDETTARQIAINLTGVIHGTREAVARMLPRGSGHIVNVASGAGKTGYAGASTYSATKFGVVGFSEAVRTEMLRTGVEISCVLPAIVRTELSTGLKGHWLVRSVEPEDVAEAIVRCLERPRFEVYVPRELGIATRVSSLLPRRTVDRLLHAVGGDAALLDPIGTLERASYDERISPGPEGTAGP